MVRGTRSNGPLAASRSHGSTHTGPDLPPELRGPVFDGVAVESWILAQAGFSPGVSSTMIRTRNPVSMRIYHRTWRIFLWCNTHGHSPLVFSIPSILELIQSGLESGLALGSLKGQVSALSVLFQRKISSRLPVVSSFHLNEDIVLPSFCPAPTHRIEKALHTLGVVRALRRYISRTAPFRKSDVLFMIPEGHRKGLPASKATLAKWLRSTIQDSYRVRNTPVPARIKARSTRSDTAGQERFHALGPIYYRDSNGAILVYDITDEDSFQKVKNWVKELRKMLGNEICLCIVGNKLDLEKERHVSVQEAEAYGSFHYEYAESVGAKHYHTSAKQNKGIEELFLDLCKRMIETAQVDERAKGNGPSQSGTARRGVQIVDDEPQAQSAGGCCSG
ncbi:unnamed protein product [Ranitomeya imitator]|uniref:Ras-related protein Rab-21 n=1 Tax=Ranitomeya imitator TaxID=111125 RepID=A0ABN9L9R6_9NEOB|nr:unnamed protein product [Ranitomeya imitator]